MLLEELVMIIVKQNFVKNFRRLLKNGHVLLSFRIQDQGLD